MNLAQIFQGGDATGSLPYDQVQEMQKALTAGYGSDVAALSGGGALRIQSLEMTMLATIQENSHFALFNALQKGRATATVDEWTEQRSVGGFFGGSTNSELGQVSAAQGDYQRRVGLVKYLMTRREVSFVQSLQNAIVDAETVEYQSGALQLLTDAEFLCFEGNSDVVPTEFDGIEFQIRQFARPQNVIDMAGQPLQNITPIANGTGLIHSNGSFGRATDLFLSVDTQTDIDTYLDPAFRVSLTNNFTDLQIGSPVSAMKTSFGKIANNPDVFIRDERYKMPFELIDEGSFAAVAAANDVFKPASIAASAPATTAGSKFVTAQAGNFYYAVAGITSKGQSTIRVSAQVAIAAGQGVVLTIAPSPGGTETGYVLYRGRRNGTNAPSDLREMVRIPRAPSGNTTYTDINEEIPGTTKAYLLNMTTGAKAITWQQFLPMMKFPFYPNGTVTIPWAQLLFGYLRLGKARHHVLYKNIVPTNAVWKPF
ncbi:hypothetical protein [Nevskia sp.]|uniref:hypothetical protein n=1 Tax=Nevskia sp. TaxID=1929292 RepID=UPI0025E6BB36|nr:hypothetical protein [Nevskia sp.]